MYVVINLHINVPMAWRSWHWQCTSKQQQRFPVLKTQKNIWMIINNVYGNGWQFEIKLFLFCNKYFWTINRHTLIRPDKRHRFSQCAQVLKFQRETACPGMFHNTSARAEQTLYHHHSSDGWFSPLLDKYLGLYLVLTYLSLPHTETYVCLGRHSQAIHTFNSAIQWVRSLLLKTRKRQVDLSKFTIWEWNFQHPNKLVMS